MSDGSVFSINLDEVFDDDFIEAYQKLSKTLTVYVLIVVLKHGRDAVYNVVQKFKSDEPMTLEEKAIFKEIEFLLVEVWH